VTRGGDTVPTVDIQIEFDAKRLDPATVQARSESVEVPGPGAAGRLEVVEWLDSAKVRDADAALVLCTADGTALADVRDGLPASDLPWTAFLTWPGFADEPSSLVFGEHAPGEAGAMVTRALAALRDYLSARADETGERLLRVWRDEGSYPYDGQPGGLVARTERDLFDGVALAASPVLVRSDVQGRKFSLRLIREALENNPTGLGQILHDVLGLSDTQIDDLSHLLKRTSLSNMITSATTVAGRLQILRGVETLLFDPTSRRELSEREQLHPLLAAEAWIFGDEYSLTVSEAGLTGVLERHLTLLGRTDELDGVQPVTGADGRRRRVDLMLTRTIDSGTGRHDHLVVEIKRPSVVASNLELAQIQGYAHAVATDQQFAAANVGWDFVLVVNKIDESVKSLLTTDGMATAPRLGHTPVRVRVLEWSQVIGQARQRLEYVRRGLELDVTEHDGLDRLRRDHPDRLPRHLRTTGP